jgi:hypothetical protein
MINLGICYESSASRFGRVCPSGETAHSTYFIGGWGNYRTSLDVVTWRIFLLRCRYPARPMWPLCITEFLLVNTMCCPTCSRLSGRPNVFWKHNLCSFGTVRNSIQQLSKFVWSEVFTVVVMKSIISWDMTPCSPLSFKWRFGGTYSLPLKGQRNRFSKPASKQVASSIWRRYVPPKRRLKLNGLHWVISQKMILFICQSCFLHISLHWRMDRMLIVP